MADDETEATPQERGAQVETFWGDVEIDPVEIAFPGGVGVTLRHYRTVLVTPTDEEDDEDVDVTEPDLDTAEPASLEPEEHEDVVFLGRKGKIFLFRTEQGLIDFITSDKRHDLRDLASFSRVKAEATAEMLQPAPEDVYELDLVVKNLRGGHDGWDPDLLVSAGEIARDMAQYADLTDVLSSLSSGSPLDDLDEALRDGGFWARRKMRKIGVETAALAWRGVIGKLTEAVEWRD